MMAALPYMQLYVADYLADTIHLDVIESGAYLHLLMNYWQTGKPLPNDQKRLARIAKCTDEQWCDCNAVVSEFFEITPVAWMHKRMERDLKNVKTKSERHKKAANIRWQKDKSSNANAYATALKSQSHTDTDTELVKEVSNDTSKSLSDEVTLAFNAYNELAKTHGLSVAQILTKSRRSSLKARLKDCGGLNGWEVALEKVAENDFLQGANERGWKANLDFISKQSNFTKIMEGGYDRERRSDGKATNATDRLREKLADQHERMFPGGTPATDDSDNRVDIRRTLEV